MASEAPSWAGQWGAGGIGAMDADDGMRSQKNTGKRAKGGFAAKAKTHTMVCVRRIKSGVKWIRRLRGRK